MKPLFKIESAHTDDCPFIGYRLTVGLAEPYLIFADQARMPGIRCGPEFSPGLGKKIEYTELEVVPKGEVSSSVTEAKVEPIKAVLEVTLDPNEIHVGDPIHDSPVGSGIMTGTSERGYPQVNNITVTWCERPDGGRFDPHKHAGGSKEGTGRIPADYVTPAPKER